MNLIAIKMKADQLYKNNKKDIIPHFFFVGYISILAQYLQSGLFSFFVAIFLCSMAHGYVKCSMKIVNDEKGKLTLEDSMVGLLDFTRVFPVYFVRKLLIVVVCGLTLLPTILSFTYFQHLFTFEWIIEAGNALIQTELFIPNQEILFPFLQKAPLFINLVLTGILYILLNSFLTFLPYIMEEDEYSWHEALVRSYYMMKGKLLIVCKLYLLYAARYIFYWFVSGIIVIIIGSVSEVFMLVCLVFSLFLYIRVIKGRIEIAKYLLYKEFIKEKEMNEEKYFKYEKDND